MPFPDSDRVIYSKNPLKEVICQLVFPAILRMDSEAPYKFQEAIRSTYPNFSEEQAANIQFLMPQLHLVQAESPAQNLPLQGKKVYKFTSDDTRWTVTLTRDSIALSTRDYRSWNDFQERFDGPLDSFFAEYAPTHTTRLGLRYINIIDPTELELEAVSWGDLLAPPIAGELADPNVREMVVGCANQVTLNMEGNTSVLLNHGLATGNPPGKVVYLIDSDFSTAEKTEVANVRTRLKDFNNNSGKLFRWCISELLHRSLDPQPSASKQPA